MIYPEQSMAPIIMNCGQVKIVHVDIGELLDRLFCECSLDDIFQAAFTLTALDKRSFAPPIESSCDRLVNMANTCETFGVSPPTVATLVSIGYNSVTLLSLLHSSDIERICSSAKRDRCKLRKCVAVLNNRTAALEPLHSLKRYLHLNSLEANNDGGNNNSKRLDWLNLDRVNNNKIKKKKPLDMIIEKNSTKPVALVAKATLCSYKEMLRSFGRQVACTCTNWSCATSSRGSTSSRTSSCCSSSSVTSSSPMVSSETCSDNSYYVFNNDHRNNNNRSRRHGYNKNNNGNNFALPPPLFVAPPMYYMNWTGRMCRNAAMGCLVSMRSGVPEVNMVQHEKRCSHVIAHCPFVDCHWEILLGGVEQHLEAEHHVSLGKNNCAQVHVYNLEFSNHFNHTTVPVTCGEVRFTLSSEEVLNDDQTLLWWGPTPFVFQDTTFFQLVYKKYEESSGEFLLLFWVWANATVAQVQSFKYEVHIEEPPLGSRRSRAFTGQVKSLQTSSTDIIGKHMRQLVFYKQSFLRQRTFRQNQTANIKYTVKIIRQSQ